MPASAAPIDGTGTTPLPIPPKPTHPCTQSTQKQGENGIAVKLGTEGNVALTKATEEVRKNLPASLGRRRCLVRLFS